MQHKMNFHKQIKMHQPHCIKKEVRTVLLSLLTVFCLLTAGCSDNPSGHDDNGHNGNGNGNGEPGPNEVTMTASTFTPQNLEITAGTTVTWSNTSSEVHTVTSGSGGQHDGMFNSGNIAPGGEFTFHFTEVGNFPYYCIPHLAAGMTGTIMVTAAEDEEENGDVNY
jgi:plastocyanin